MANIKRLIELRDKVLPFIPAKRLRMKDWTGEHDKLPNGCGTVACVAGWAGVHPPFNREGYSLSPLFHKPGFYPVFKGVGTSALDRFFGVNDAEFDHIFGTELPNDPVLIAQHITDVIEANT